ncbi:FxSxx-COOH system tetratricopeptide repeat protein [Actinoplanes sp. NPDC049265]|uniref:FxSxx-COOH system tetratricopeptide repeat protein n=1 Tax=Actinoplanes sp. NPDC049265 TaxID=3363902 RepID=UPI003720731E
MAQAARKIDGGGVTPPSSEVTIGIVAALWIEGLALRELAPDLSALPPVPGDPNHYHIGRLPSSQENIPHRVVLTTMPRDSTRNAAAICTNLIRSFPQVQCVIMVGIAGGIPSPHRPERHVRLGDIVVAIDGVMDFTHVRQVDGVTTPRRHIDGLSEAMMRAVLELRGDEFRDEPRWRALLDAHQRPDLANFQRPRPATDVLLVRGERVRHPSRHQSGHVAGLPKVHYGSIATGDVLLRDEIKRDQLAVEYGVLAVEMEASGIAAGTATAGKHWFMVRGISDYCDNAGKTDLWHPYASLAAAAYVRAMLAACHPFDAAIPSVNGEGPVRSEVLGEERAARTELRCQEAVQELLGTPFWESLSNRRSFTNVLRTKVQLDLSDADESDPAAHLNTVLVRALDRPEGLVAILEALGAMPTQAQVSGAVAALEGLKVRDLLPGPAALELMRILSEAPTVDMAAIAASHNDVQARAGTVPASPQAAFDEVLGSFAHPRNVRTLLAMADRLLEAVGGDLSNASLARWRKQVATHLGGVEGVVVWNPIHLGSRASALSDPGATPVDKRTVGVVQEVTDSMAKSDFVRVPQVSALAEVPDSHDPGGAGTLAGDAVQPPPAIGPRALPPVWGNVPPRNPHFTGRQAMLDDLSDRLRKTDLTAVLPQAIHGMGGVGKSQLAVEYVYRHQGEYDVIWWISAERPQQILAALAELAQYLDLPVGPEANAAVPAVREALRLGRPYGNWLLVFDNAEDLEAVQSVVPTGGRGKVLVTSRNADWSLQGNSLEVDVFSRDESVNLLRRRDPDIADEDAVRLAEALGDLPLAIEQAAAWRVATGMTAAEYLELLRDRVELLDATASPGYERSVAAAWTMSLDRLREANPAAMRLLEICSFFAPEPISRAFFSNAGASPGQDPNQPFEQALRDPIKLNKAFRDIQRYALARINHRTGTIELHRLVQAVVREGVDAERRDEVRRRGHQLLASADPREPDNSNHWDRYQALISHALASGTGESDDPWVRDLVFDLIKFLYRWGDHEGCERLAGETYETWKRTLGVDSPETLKVAKYFGYILWVNGEFSRAREIGEEALRIYQEHFDQGDEDLIDAKLQVARDLHTAGRFAEATVMVREALAASRRFLTPEDPKTLYAAHQLGVSLRLEGRFQEAREIDEETLRLRIEVLGADDFETLHTNNDLTIDQRECGDYNGAWRNQENVFAQHRLKWGEYNPATTRAGRNLAVARRKSGDHAGALDLSRQIEKRFRERYGESYPDTVASAMNLAVDLRQNGELPAAREMGENALRIYEKLLGRSHPFALAARTNQAITLRLLGEAAEAKNHNHEACEGLRTTIGPDHPLSITAATNLASDHYALGEYQIAFELDSDTLDRARRVFGEDHPSTLAVVANLALDLRALGRVGEADAQHRDVVERYRLKLGAGHPATVNASRHVRADCDIDPMPI